MALLADGSPQGMTPRNENRMMSADKVARKMAYGLRVRKNEMILTPIGKLTKLFDFVLPRFVELVEYYMMAKEPDSPMKKK